MFVNHRLLRLRAPSRVLTVQQMLARGCGVRVLSTSAMDKKRLAYSRKMGKIKDKYKETPPPPNWMAEWTKIEKWRGDGIEAPVDTHGCYSLADRDTDPKLFRYQTLVAAMLSSQTKDEVNAKAMEKLKHHGLNIDNILQTGETQLQQLIHPVSFHRRKAGYILKTSQILRDEYDYDVPKTEEELASLPGVGQKMATLVLHVAWGIHESICVDVHVHRIANRMGWVNTSTPEETRFAIEAWLPKKNWSDINGMLVGFGQLNCRPIFPRCNLCPISHTCPKHGVEEDVF